MNARGIELSIVVPVYNSSDCLPALLERLERELARSGRRYEIVLVDDDSTDDSWSVLRAEAARRPALRAARLMRNAGQVPATLCGLELARGAIVVTLDDDLQHPPDQIAALVAALEAAPELDAVFGQFAEKHHRGYRNLASRLLGALHRRAFGLPRGVRPSSFRALRRRLVDAVLRHPHRAPSLTTLIAASTRRVATVPVRHDPRWAGRSNYTLGRQLALAFDNLAGSSTAPLRAVSAIGLVFCVGSFGYGLVVLGRYLSGRIAVPGWTTLALLALLSTGLVLVALGVIGEYLARVLREVRAGPRHVVRERLGEVEPTEPASRLAERVP